MSLVSIADYIEATNLMTPDETASHLRHAYRVSEQLWPDYLDYLEEWDNTYFIELNQTRKDFIYQYLAKHNQRMKCVNHYHTFTSVCPTDPNHCDNQGGNSVIVIPSPDAEIDYSSCWYTLLVSQDELLRSINKNCTAIRLSNPEAQLIKELTQLRVLKTGLTFERLSFEDFRDNWWSKESPEHARRMFQNSRTPAFSAPEETVLEMKQHLPQPQALWLDNKPTGVISNVMPSEEVITFHGLHSLLRARDDRNIILQMINDIRIGDPIKEKALSQAISKCHTCRTIGNRPIAVSPTGFYYSPPGNGKTTSQRNETFVGIDTDWLTKEDFFSNVCAPFLARGIPVLTNQYCLAIHCGEKLIGNFASNHLRVDIKGKPYTTLPEICKANIIMHDDMYLQFRKVYFEESLLNMYRVNYLYNQTRQRFLEKRTPSHRPAPRVEYVSPTILCQLINNAATAGTGIKHRRRRRARKR